MNKKRKHISILLSYILIYCLVVGTIPATTFAGDSTHMTEATKPTKKVVEMTEATKPDTQKTMKVTDVETQETKEVEIEKPKEEKPKEEKPTETQTIQKVPITQQATMQTTEIVTGGGVQKRTIKSVMEIIPVGLH